MHSVTIIHNTFGERTDPLYPSRAGVMDQVEAVARSLERLRIDYQVEAVEDLRDLTAIVGSHRRPLIFNLVEEFLSSIEQACYVPAVCSAFDGCCTGSDTAALLLAQNKIHTKAVLRQAGLPCPDGIVVRPADKMQLNILAAGRYIIKPVFCDASEGISDDSIVMLPDESQRAAELVGSLHRRFSQPVIVEQFIPHRELNVSVIDDGSVIKVLALAEIDFGAFGESRNKIVDYDAKWRKDSFTYNNTPRKIPAELPVDVAEIVKAVSVGAFEAVGCSDYARVDFRLDEDLNPFILEVNPNPDISPDAGFAAALQASGIRYEEFVETALHNARRRSSEFADSQ